MKILMMIKKNQKFKETGKIINFISYLKASWFAFVFMTVGSILIFADFI